MPPAPTISLPQRVLLIMDAYAKNQSKLTQVIQNLFTKAAQVIVLCRWSEQQSLDRVNKWFNLLMAGDYGREDLRGWKSGELTNLPPMIIETFVDLYDVEGMTVEVEGKTGRVPIANGSKRQVVLERWLVEFDTTTAELGVDELPAIYKQAIVLFRTMYGFLALMPGHRVRNWAGSEKGVAVRNKVMDGGSTISSKGRVGLSKTVVGMDKSEDHLVHRGFNSIRTTMGTVRVSVAYRTDFVRPRLVAAAAGPGPELEPQTQQPQIQQPQTQTQQPQTQTQQPQTQQPQTQPSPPQTQPSREIPDPPETSTRRPPIQPFKVGSMGASPPGSLERRVSITSNKSASNASLAAMLRNPRGSISSTTGIPISGSIAGTSAGTSAGTGGTGGTGGTVPASALPNPEPNSRFSSSFGSRASRRLSTPSRHAPDVAGPLLPLSGTPISGLYVDDDIGDFVRMIDNKNEFRFSSDASKLSIGSNSQMDPLSKFHSLKSHHQQLGDNVSQSVLLHANSIRSNSIRSRRSTGSGESVRLPSEPAPEAPPKRSVHYENVFEDDDGEDYYLKKKEEDEDELLFTMSDMNLGRK